MQRLPTEQCDPHCFPPSSANSHRGSTGPPTADRRHRLQRMPRSPGVAGRPLASQDRLALPSPGQLIWSGAPAACPQEAGRPVTGLPHLEIFDDGSARVVSFFTQWVVRCSSAPDEIPLALQAERGGPSSGHPQAEPHRCSRRARPSRRDALPDPRMEISDLGGGACDILNGYFRLHYSTVRYIVAKLTCNSLHSRVALATLRFPPPGA